MQAQNVLATAGASTGQYKLDDETISLNPDTPDLGLISYAQEFGLGLHNLDQNNLAILRAARELEPFARGFKIPMAQESRSNGKMVVVEREVEEIIERTTYRDGANPSSIPDNLMEVSPTATVTELPEILPGQWLLDEVAPDLFLRRLGRGELLKRQWFTPTQIPEKSFETIRLRRKFEEPAPPEIEKQHAYVLLDVSGSMANEDGRGLVAKGLALAFLKVGYEQRARLHIRPFTDTPGILSQAQSEQEFHALARKVLEVGIDGGTSIQQSLVQAVSDISSGGEFTRADILLITDGYSYLDANPLGNIRLHSCILGDPRKDAETRKGRQELERALDTLKKWSESYHELKPDNYEGLILPRKDELDPLQSYIDSIPEQIEAAEELQAIEAIREALRKILEFLRANPEAGRRKSKLEAEALQALSLLPGAEQLEELRSQRAREQVEAQARREAKRLLDLEELGGELANFRGGIPSRGGSGGLPPPPVPPPYSERRSESLWQRLVRWLKKLR